MSEIKVVKKTDKKTISLEERSIYYEKLKDEYKIEGYHFDNLLEFERTRENWKKPKILGILSRKVMQSPYIIPIVYDPSMKSDAPRFQRVNLNVSEQDPENEGDGVEDAYLGGKEKSIKKPIKKPVKKPKDQKIKVKKPRAASKAAFKIDVAKPKTTADILKPPKEEQYSITTQLSTAKETLLISNRLKDALKTVKSSADLKNVIWRHSIGKASRQDFNVCGFIFREPVQDDRICGEVKMNTMRTRIRGGLYDFTCVAKDSRFVDTFPLMERTIFQDEKHAREMLGYAFDYLKFLYEYQRSTTAFSEVNHQIMLSVEGKSRKKWLQNLFRGSKQPPVKDIPPMKLDPIVSRLGKFRRFTARTYEGLIHELMSAKLYDLYIHAQLNGMDSKFEEQLQNLAEEQKFEENMRKSKMEEDAAKARNMHYLAIVSKKFGTARANELNPSKDILTQLKKAERSLIEIEYAKQTKYAELWQKNPCPHVPLEKEFRQRTSIKQKAETFAKLDKYIDRKKKNDNGVYMCTNCKFPTVCPHVVDHFELLQRGKVNPTEIRNLFNSYASEVDIEHVYFCKFCGEQLMDAVSLEGENEFESDYRRGAIERPETDPIADLIWSESSYMIRSLVQFKTNVDTRQIIKHIYNLIKSEIDSIQTRLSKAKTSTEDEVMERLRLYAAIYAVGVMLSIIARNPKKMWTRKDASGKKGIQKDFMAATKFLLNTKNVTIAKNNISTSSLGIMIKKAYLLGTKGAQWKEVVEKRNPLQSVLIDPLYLYGASLVNIDLAKQKKPPVNYRDFQSIVGKTFSELNSYVDIFKEFYEKSKSFKTDTDEALQAILGFQFWCLYIQTAYTEPIGMGEKSYNAEITNLLKDLKQVTEKIRSANLRAHMLSYGQVPFERGYKFDPDANVNLAHIYDNQGREHNWNIYILSIGGKTYEVAREDISRIYKGLHKITVNQYLKSTVKDVKCSVCGNKKSTIKDNGILRALEKNSLIDNFFRYYEYRCPVAGTHEWIGTGKHIYCKKCKVAPHELKDQKQTYYNKYSSKFKQREEKVSRTFEKSVIYPVKFVTKWKANMAPVAEVAKKYKVKYNIISNIGMIENEEYLKIEKGEINPSTQKEITINRFLILDGHITMVIQEYELLRGRSMEKYIPFKIKDLIDSSDWNYADLPDLFVEYNENVDAFPRDDAVKISTFALIALCRALSKLNTSHKHRKTLEAFGKYILDKIIEKERFSAEAVDFTYTMLTNETDDNAVYYESDEEYVPDDEEFTERFSTDNSDYEHIEDHDYHGEY